jgi:hypothetical protein
MNLSNYREMSGSDLRAGFQFEFHCQVCSRTWKSPFKPYRRAQLAAWVYRLSRFLNDRGGMFRGTNAIANLGEHRAREKALQEALALAGDRYTECPSCQKAVDEDCWDVRARLCQSCRTAGGGLVSPRRSESSEPSTGLEVAAPVAGLKCPNCSSPIGGGRFCAECGFDMASTHKTCPGCGTMCMRSSRFCLDCGHGF